MRLVLCTAPLDRAEALATGLVEQRLAACVNLMPVTSVYRWKGEVTRDPETLMMIKAPAETVDALRGWLLQHHPYELPEILALDVDADRSHAAWLDWVRRLGD